MALRAMRSALVLLMDAVTTVHVFLVGADLEVEGVDAASAPVVAGVVQLHPLRNKLIVRYLPDKAIGRTLPAVV